MYRQQNRVSLNSAPSTTRRSARTPALATMAPNNEGGNRPHERAKTFHHPVLVALVDRGKRRHQHEKDEERGENQSTASPYCDDEAVRWGRDQGNSPGTLGQ